MDKLIIVGTSSTAKTIFSFVKKYSLFEVIGFAVNKQYKTQDSFCELPVFEIESLDDVMDKQKDFLFVAVQWNNLNGDRRRIFENLKKNGYRFANLISPLSVVNGIIDGENCWITDLSILDFNSRVGDNTFIKCGAYIGPNSIINNHCFIGAKSFIAGGVEIGEQSFVGVSSVIFDEVKVGKKCIVGAATALKRNLDDFCVYKTSLDNCVVKQYGEEVIESKLQFSKNVRK